MDSRKTVVLVGDVDRPPSSGETSVYVLPEPLDLHYIKSKQPDMVVIFDRAIPNSALEYARFLRRKGVVPEALLVAAYPNGHMPETRELRQAGIALAISEPELEADLPRVFQCALRGAATTKAEQMSLMSDVPKQADIPFAAAAAGVAGPGADEANGRTDQHVSSATIREDPGVTNAASTPAPLPGQIACLECKRWRPASDDKFCAWCGARLVRLRCDPVTLDFRTDQREPKSCPLNLHNDGINTLYASLEVAGPPEIKGRFKIMPEARNNAVEVPGGAMQSISVAFDNSGIDPTVDYSAALEIYTNVDEAAIYVPLRVARPPVARLVLPPGPQSIVYGDPAVLLLSVRNTGGGLLDISGIKLEEYGIPSIAASAVASGLETSFELPLDLEKVKLRPGAYVARGNVVFRNHSDLPFAIEFTFSRPARIQLEQERILLDLYNIGRNRHCGAKFQNIGLETLKILSVKTGSEWLSTLCGATDILPGTDGYIDIFVNAATLEPGSYSSELTIQTNGYVRDVCMFVDLNIQEMAPLKEAIGIDFGTSVSCAAIVRNDKPVLIPLDRSSNADSIDARSLPSVVFFEENFFPLVGAEAQDRATRNPAAAVRAVKRILGSRRKIRIRGQEKSPEQVATEIFRALFSAVERSTVEGFQVEAGSPVNALFTVPADISDEQIKSVLVSARNAGLEIADEETSEYVIDEPSAAAMYYLWKRSELGECDGSELVFIYDFGAGTLDCSLVEITNNDGNLKIRVLATAGDPRLGGDDIDLEFARMIARQIAGPVAAGLRSHPVVAREDDLVALANKSPAGYEQARRVREKARRAAEFLKIELSTKSKATVKFPAADGQETEVTVTREQFEALLGQFIQRSDRVVLGCCSIARRKPEEVHTLLHSGRGSAIPKLRQRVKQLFPSANDDPALIEAKECVALGAAWWAHIKNLPPGGGSIEVEGVGRVLPNTICYRQRAKGRVGVVNVPVFQAGEIFPAERTLELPTQKGKKWRLDISEMRFGADDQIRARGSVKLEAQPNARAYEATFRININRILEVSVGGKTLTIEPAEDEIMETGGAR